MTLRTAFLGIALALVAGLGLAHYVMSRSTSEAAQQSTASTQAHGEALAHVDQAKTSDQKAEQQARAIRDAESEVQRLRVEVARMRKIAAPAVAPSTPTAEPVAPVADLAPLVAKQDELIQAQDVEIRGLKAQVLTLATSRDQWKGAYEAESRARTAQAMALEAQVSAAKAARWSGRFEGFAVGAALGYVGGKL